MRGHRRRMYDKRAAWRIREQRSGCLVPLIVYSGLFVFAIMCV